MSGRGLVVFSCLTMFAFLLLDGSAWVPFELDTWVLVALIVGIMGSSAVYFVKWGCLPRVACGGARGFRCNRHEGADAR